MIRQILPAISISASHWQSVLLKEAAEEDEEVGIMVEEITEVGIMVEEGGHSQEILSQAPVEKPLFQDHKHIRAYQAILILHHLYNNQSALHQGSPFFQLIQHEFSLSYTYYEKIHSSSRNYFLWRHNNRFCCCCLSIMWKPSRFWRLSQLFQRKYVYLRKKSISNQCNLLRT